MFRSSYQRGLLTILFSSGSNPLHIWETHTQQDGYIKRFLDNDIKNMVLEVRARNVSTTYITCPKGNQVLGIHLPFLVMVVKNLDQYFTFEITVLDETSTKRRFRVANFQSTTTIFPMSTVMPICLSKGWNQIQFNLAEFCRKAYSKNFTEVLKVKINANIRIRRIYFAESLPSEEELPADYKLFFPLQTKKKKAAVEKPPEKQEATKEPPKAEVEGPTTETAPEEGAVKEQPTTEKPAEAEQTDNVEAPSEAVEQEERVTEEGQAGSEHAETEAAGEMTPVTEPQSEGAGAETAPEEAAEPDAPAAEEA